MREKKRLGDMLVEAGLIDQHQLGAALGRQRQWGGRIGTNLILMGFITEGDIAQFLSDSLKLPQVDLSRRDAEPEALALIKESVATRYSVLPLSIRRKGGRDVLEIAMADPTNLEAIDTISAVARMKVEPFVATDRDVMSAVDHYYRGIGRKPVARGPLTPPPMERLALVRPRDEQLFDLDGGRASPIPVGPTIEDDPPVVVEPPRAAPPLPPPPPPARPPAAAGSPPPPPPPVQAQVAQHRVAAEPRPAPPLAGQDPAPALAAGATVEDLARSIRETRAMVVVLAEMLMEQGVVDQEEFYRRYGLKKILV